MVSDFRVVDSCRVCASGQLWEFLSLGDTPLANAFVRPSASEPERRFPLALVRCAACGHVQLTVVVRADILFRDYAYASSASSPMIDHFRAMAQDLVSRYSANGMLAVEIGSNDGILLRPLASAGARAVGVEPASNLAAVANAAGLATWNEFFTEAIAGRLSSELGRARLVIANNVLAHIDDLDDLCRGLDALLDDEGVFVAEVPYLAELLERVEYDTVYHEHLSYFAVGPLRTLFDRRGLDLFEVERQTVHGGSLRIHVGRPGRHRHRSGLASALAEEEKRGINDRSPYLEFARQVTESREALRSMITRLHRDGKRVAGYGAAAKGNTLLNVCDLGADEIEFVVDSTTYKQGLVTPGTHIPIGPERWILERRPDYALLLAWNHADAIVAKNKEYARRGGRFIHPVPLARVLG
jgi:SAM-dependent methyltransferase